VCAAAEGSLGLPRLTQDHLTEFDCGDAPANFLKKLKTDLWVLLKHLLLSFGTTLSAGLQTKTRLSKSLVLAFLHAGVAAEAGAS